MSNKIIYNKLVRDKIPLIIADAGKEYEIHTAEDAEYLEKLLDKVEEELEEFREEPSIKEMADIYEVLDALVDYFDFDKQEILSFQKKKRKNRGGFKERIILDKVIED